MLELESLRVDYGEGPVIESLSLNLEAGKVHGFVGRNGEGKTTLLNTIYGTVKLINGTVRWAGLPLLSDHIAYLETELYFYPLITGKEYLRLFHSRNPSFDLNEWNRLFELPLHEFIDTYSTGMKKKLALMSVLSFDRPIVMLDEPSNGLDLESNLFLTLIIRQLASRGVLVIVTSHVLESLESACDYVHVLRNGCIERSYSSSEFSELRTNLVSEFNETKVPALEQLLNKSKPLPATELRI